MADKRLWFKLDVGYLDNPKISELVDDQPRAIILHLTCIAYAKQHGTDGRVPMRQAMRRACAEQCDLDACIDLGILRMDGDRHLMVHDYVRHQGSAAENAETAETASRRASHAARVRWGARNDAPSNAPSIAPSNAPGMPERCSTDAEPMQSREEKRREERTTSPAGDGQFDEWWKAYPRKVGKGQARRAYTAALKKTSHDHLLAAATKFAQRMHGSDPKFVAHPATWLNGERWDDQDDTMPSIGRTVTDGDGTTWDLGEWG